MTKDLATAKDRLIQEMGRLSSFVGFNKAMGQIYGLLYLNPEPLSLGEIAEQLGISKGNASLNIKTMERWGLVQPINKNGDRRDFYQAETDFWKIVQDIIHERDRKEIEHTLKALEEILGSVKNDGPSSKNTENHFCRERLANMLEFGEAANQMLQAVITMGDVRNRAMTRSPASKRMQSIRIEE